MGNFKKLRVWMKAKDLAVNIYKLTEGKRRLGARCRVYVAGPVK